MLYDFDGLNIAWARIVAEKSARTGFLDLGRLGLTEMPAELFELEHLSGLNLGVGWDDKDGHWHLTELDLGENQLDGILVTPFSSEPVEIPGIEGHGTEHPVPAARGNSARLSLWTALSRR